MDAGKESAEEDHNPLIGDFQDIDKYTQSASRAILQAIRCGHTLPAPGDDYDYYSSFESFRTFMDIESSRLLQIIQKIIRYHGIKGNLTSNQTFEVEDKFDVLVDANDQILERAGTFIDEAAGVRKETPLLLASTATKPGSQQGCWNKKGRAAASTKGFSFRLLAAKNIQRPQLRFKDKVDNSYKPFIPKIKEKPNALKSLTEIMTMESESETATIDENVVYPHPYHYELDHFQPTAAQLEKGTPQLPKPVEETELIFVRTESTLRCLVDELKTCSEFAVDVEHHSYRSFLGITCLMQISTRSKDYIVDALELRSELHILNVVFTDPKIVKVLHGADSDVEWLQRDLGLYLVNLFDTGQAARVLGFSRYSLAHLMQHFCGVDPDKQFQLADWRIRPLPEELVRYAREDTHYLLYIYDRVRAELLTRGNTQSNLLRAVLDRSRQICAKKYEKPVFDDECHKELYKKSKKVFNSQQLHALKGLFAWRDKTARNEDESTGYVLPNHMLLQIAESLPRDPQGILACCNPIPPIVRQNTNELQMIIKASREIALYKVESSRSNMKPTRLEHPKYSINLLHCPHDTSHSDTQRDIPNITDFSGVVSHFSKLMGYTDGGAATTVSQKTSSLWTPGSQKVSTEATKKVDQILTQFSNPFEMYFPLRSDESAVVMTSDNMSLATQEDSNKWRLKAHTPRRQVAAPEKKVAVPITQPVVKQKIVIDSSGEEEEIQPLRRQLPSKRALKKEAKLKEKGQDEGTPEAAGGSEEPSAKRTKPQQVRVRPTVQQLEESGFRSHDYSQTDFKKLFEGPGSSRGSVRRGRGRGGRGGGRYYVPDSKDFNPHHKEPTSEHRPAGKPPIRGTYNSNKSLSYKKGSGERTAKIHWPKR